jgi:hypothetical protein
MLPSDDHPVKVYLLLTGVSAKFEGHVKLKLLRASVLIASLALPVFAQNPARGQLGRILGTIDSFNRQVLSVKSQDGQATSITVPPDLRVMANAKAGLADIMPGATALIIAAQKDGGLVATGLTAEKDGVKPR